MSIKNIMNYEAIKNTNFYTYLNNKKFLVLCVIIFIFLYIFCTFIKFVGQLPILLILTFIIAYYIYNMLHKKKVNSES